MPESLKEKTVKGTVWSAVGAFLGQGISFFVGIVLARLLSPSEYGLIGICTIFTIILTGVVDSGFSNALIRKKETTNNDYNTMFITNMVMSILLYVGLFLISPLIANFFGKPELVWLIRVMGIILIFQALSITQVTILTKRIDFKTKAKASVVAAISSGVIGIGMAFAGYGVWSLVAQQLTNKLMYTICLWLLNKWWPKVKFSLESFRYMWGFGWKLMVSGLLNNIWNQLYQVVVGKFYSPATLGQYSRSKEYANLFSANITSLIQRVTYPVIAEMQDDPQRMISGYRRIIKTSMLVTAATMISMGAVSEPLIYCLIGPQWHEAATYLPLICISMSIYPLHAINLNMLQVQGRSDIFLFLEILKKIIAIGPLFLGIFVNVYWMLVASIVVGLICFFLNSYYTGKKLGYSSWMQLMDVAPSYGIAFVVASAIYFLKYLPWSYWIILPVQIVVGSFVFFFVSEYSQLSEYKELKAIFTDLIKRKSKTQLYKNDKE